jgi:hypothetical protein
VHSRGADVSADYDVRVYPATAAIAWLTDALIKRQSAPTITIRKAVNAFALFGQVSPNNELVD